jgi:hypothetical protein
MALVPPNYRSHFAFYYHAFRLKAMLISPGKGLDTSKPRVPFDTIEQAKDWLVQ